MTRRQIALVGSLVVTVLVVVVVLVFGIVRPPEFPRLEDADASLPARVAFVQDAGGEDCVVVVDRDGESTRGLCDDPLGGFLHIDREGRLVLREFEEGATVLQVLDPATGQLVERIVVADEDARSLPEPEDPPVLVDEQDGVLVVSVVEDRGEEVLARVEAPRDYRLRPAGWSPDKRWLLLADSADRLLAVSTTGEGPYVVADDGREPLWVPS